jgi:hypothetical protein
LGRFIDSKCDDVLTPIFNDFAGEGGHAPSHDVSPRRVDALPNGNLSGQAVRTVSGLPVQREHFAGRRGLFVETVNAQFVGLKAEEAKERAASVDDICASRVGLLKDAPAVGLASSGEEGDLHLHALACAN